MEALERGWTTRDVRMMLVRGDPRYAALMRRMKLA
jgi:hypothetical protein